MIHWVVMNAYGLVNIVIQGHSYNYFNGCWGGGLPACEWFSEW